MNKFGNFITGTRILEVVESPINGRVEVIKSLAFGTHIRVEGLTQSGGVVTDVWRETLKKLKNQRTKKLKNCLILGLGGGSAAKLVKKFWPARAGEPEAEITGVDLDPVMIELGKKYLGFDENINTIIGDAYEICKKLASGGKKFDLILTDVYIGYQVPQQFESEDYIQRVRKLLSESRDSPSRGLASGGIAIFNRLYSAERRPKAQKFARKLEKVFKKVDPIYPEANVMFVCSN